MVSKLKPLYKWTGGKRKEIKVFSDYYPNFVKNSNEYTFVEPFFGGGAVYWSLMAKNNVINDVDFDLINFLNQIKINKEGVMEPIIELSNTIKNITEKEKLGELSIGESKTERGKSYYEWRNLDRNEGGLDNLSLTQRASRFFILNQLAFSGMRRFNSKGQFNVPYGNYKTFNINICDDHTNHLTNTQINQGSYEQIMLDNDTDNTFMFLDPPYTRTFKEYSHGNVFGNDEQIKLANIFKKITKAKVMIIINKDEFTSGLYDGYVKHEYDLQYANNIKNRYDNSVKHLIITNY